MKEETQKMINYLEKTSKHLFQRRSFMEFSKNAYKYQGYMFKLFPITIDGINYRVKVEFNDLNTNVYIRKVEAQTKNSFNIMKTDLFPHRIDDEKKTKSIRTFKKVREMMNEVKNSEFKSIKEAKEKITEIFTQK